MGTRGWQLVTVFGIIALVVLILTTTYWQTHRVGAGGPISMTAPDGPAGMPGMGGPGGMMCPMGGNMPMGGMCPMRGSMMGAMMAPPPAPADAPPRMPLIGEDAPAFKAATTAGPIDFPKDYEGKWVILFSHPADFTPVCTTEFMTFQSMLDEFEALNCRLVGLSIDSNFSHIAWLRKIADLEYKGMKKVMVTFPVISDIKMDVAKKYGMVQPAASDTQAVRAVFFIDPKAKIRALIYYPLSNGRNMQEIKRLLIAMQTSDAHKVSTPANWQPGDDVIVPPPGSCGAANDRMKDPGPGVQCLDWFLCLKPLPKADLKLPPEK